MRAVARWMLGVLAVGVVGTAARAQETPAPLQRADLDKRLGVLVYDTIKEGVTLFNEQKNADGCYRLYYGSLTVISGLLDHRPTLMKAAKDALAKSKTQTPNEAAFALRKVLDDIQGEVSGTGKKPLWDRLGGEPAVKAVIHDFVLAAAPDPKVNFFRDGKYKLDAAGVEKLERLLVELVSSATGGPLKYSGRGMKESHAGMKITDAEFDALAGHLVAVLKKYNVPKAETDELVNIVAGTRKDIVDATAMAAPAKKALWDRLGGEAAVKLVVHDFVVAAAGDPKVDFFRGGKYKLDADGVKKLEQHLVELVSATTGGPLKYNGRGMKESHAGMKIKESEFNALANHLVDALKKYNVPKAEIDELVAIVGTTKKDIVEEK
jgi:hemoglobin